MKHRSGLAALALWVVLAAAGQTPPAADCGADAQARCARQAHGVPARRRSSPGLGEEGIQGRVRPGGLAHPFPEAGVPSPSPPVRPLPAPAPVIACDPQGCLDSSGTRYNGWGPGMIRGDGKLCQRVGNMMRCD